MLCALSRSLRTLTRRNNSCLPLVVSRSRHEDSYFLVDAERELQDPEYSAISNEYLGYIAKGHRTLVIQPYIKWGRGKKQLTNKELQLAESVALVESLPHWLVVDRMCVPLMTLQRKELFGKGKLDEVRAKVHLGANVTAVFISTNVLKHVQVLELQRILGVPVYDRYSLVIHIFRSHAKSPEARLQVALAEIPYVYKKMAELGGAVNLLEKRKMYLQSREAKLREGLKKLQVHRQVIRDKRKSYGFATIAVVGYTNAGKTSLIKALTNDAELTPRNYLFATLDTTAHAGLLPCKMKVLYIDTIGFIQDVPERLIEPFVATLEDAMVADIIVHVYDLSHPDRVAQIDHVRKTLRSLSGGDRPLIEVANKCDLVGAEAVPEDSLPVSSLNLTGIDVLRHQIQKLILTDTGRSIMRMRVSSGSPEAAWLYKEGTVITAEADPSDPQFMLLDVITTENMLHRFRRFLRQ